MNSDKSQLRPVPQHQDISRPSTEEQKHDIDKWPNDVSKESIVAEVLIKNVDLHVKRLSVFLTNQNLRNVCIQK
jgi:hypothetical protein